MTRKTVKQTPNKPKQRVQQLNRLSTFFSQLIFQKQTWLLIADWLVWQLPTRRSILKLINQLVPLRSGIPADRSRFRDRIFSLACLELKKSDRQHLVELLNQAHDPTGLEQAFFSSIFPQIIKRGLASVPRKAQNPSQLHVEIGYLAHNEDYFFWVLEIDGERKDNPDRRTIVPDLEIQGQKKYVKYPLGVARLIEGLNIERVTTGNIDPLGWIINSQTHFNRVLIDLKKRNYKITTVERPIFELGRLKLLRRLDLQELKKRQSQSERRNPR